MSSCISHLPRSHYNAFFIENGSHTTAFSLGLRVRRSVLGKLLDAQDDYFSRHSRISFHRYSSAVPPGQGD